LKKLISKLNFRIKYYFLLIVDLHTYINSHFNLLKNFVHIQSLDYGVYNMYMELELISSMQENMHPRDIIVDKMHHRCTFWDGISYRDPFGDITRSLDRFPVYLLWAHLEIPPQNVP
jgi:hypothetical protein